MKQSELFTKTKREVPKDEEAINAQLLIKGGFIDKVMAGVYSFLPLGYRVLSKIEDIVREEMNSAGGQEVLMPALHPKDVWQKTGRWESFDALFKLKSRLGGEYALGPTHEEVLYPLLTKHIKSYRDLPVAIYQIQTKFREEARAKSGLLRSREFRMKDLYSFHSSDKDRDKYYGIMEKVYAKTFERVGLEAIPTQASGGTFSELSLEFQVVSEAGEDTIFLCKKCNFAVNKEIAGAGQKCPRCKGPTKKENAIEVGNIFPLKEKYAKDFNVSFRDKGGQSKLVSAGCYGIGTSRIMGTIAETSNDKNGIIWPKEVAPFNVHLVSLNKNSKKSDDLYANLQKRKIEVLYDNREEATAGEKFADSDLIGIPLRAVLSDKTGDKIEVKKRHESKIGLFTESEFMKVL